MPAKSYALRRRLPVLAAACFPVCGFISGALALAETSSSDQTAASLVVARQPASKPPSYDVASIKPHQKSDDNGSSIGTHDGSFSAVNVSLESLLVSAYGIRRGLIFGIPKWAEDARFDVQAKALDADPADLKKLTKEQQQAMLAAMLADRMQIRVHQETKELPVYDLTVARDGPKMKADTGQEPGEGSNKGLVPGSWRTSSDGSGQTELDADGIPMSSLVEILSDRLNRTVIDKTGLTSKYDLLLKWVSNEGALRTLETGSPADPGPSIFTALEEQLGLKLLPAKGSVITLVVDHAEVPSAN